MKKPTMKNLLVLTCDVCGFKNDIPMCDVSNFPEQYSWAKCFAYLDCMTPCEKEVTPKVGDELVVQVDYPLCCRVGGTFSVTMGDDGDFVTMRLLEIIKHNVYSAIILVRIVELNNRLAYVQPVPEEVRRMLDETKSYNYEAPGIFWLSEYGYLKDGIMRFKSNNSDPLFHEDYIYTDEDGIDHLVEQCNLDDHNREAYYGDKVLGYHKYSPYFPPTSYLPDGSVAPDVPYGFVDRLKYKMGNDGIIPYLLKMTNAVKNRHGDILFATRGKLYCQITVIWIGDISIEGFLHAMKLAMEGLAADTGTTITKEMMMLYNDMARELGARSIKTVSVDKFYYDI